MLVEREVIIIVPRPKSFKIPRHLIVIFLLLSISIWAAGYLYYENQKEYIKKHEQDELSAIADLQASRIEKWRRERRGDAEVIYNNPIIITAVQQLIKSKSPKLKQEIYTHIKSLQEHYQYKGVVLLDTEGNILLAVPDGKEILGPDAKRLTEEAILTKKVVFSDLYRSKISNIIRLTIVAPLFVEKKGETVPVGSFLLHVDPYQFLYKLIQTWPTPSPTAETLLVRREGDKVMFLNELRHRKGVELTLHTSINDEHCPAAMAARGIEGVVEGIDYQGVPVLAAIRVIPDSPWFLVAKVDKEEIYVPIRDRLRVIAFVIILLVIGSAVSIGLFWHRQTAKLYRKQYESECRQVETLQKYEYLTRYANDIIILADRDGKIIEANNSAIMSYGYTMDELLQLNIRALRSPNELPLFEKHMEEAEAKKSLVFKTVHMRRDGTTFPVEVSARFIEIEGRSFILAINRDITERKQAEKALVEAQRSLEAVVETAPSLIVLTDPDGCIMLFNRACEELTGYKREEVFGKTITELFLPPEWIPIVQKRFADPYAPEVLAPHENPWVTKSGEKRLIEWRCTVLPSPKYGRPCILGTGVDITERKKTEDALHLERNKLKNIMDTMEEGVFIVNKQYDIEYVNPAIIREFGATDGRKCYEYFHDRTEVCPWCKNQEIFDGKTIRWEWYSSKTDKTYDLFGTPLRNPDGSISKMEIFHDITERKRVEKEIQERDKELEDITMELALGLSEVLEALNKIASGDPRVRISGVSKNELLAKLKQAVNKTAEEIGTIVDQLHEFAIGLAEHFDVLNRVSKGELNARITGDSKDELLRALGKVTNQMIVSVSGEIAERKKAEGALRVEKNFIDSTINSLPGIFYWFDGNGRFLQWNKNIEVITGYSGEEILKMSFLDFFDEEEKKLVEEAIKKVFTGGGESFLEANLVLKDGRKIPYFFTGKLFISSYQKYLVGMGIDITDRKQAEEKVYRLNMELEQRVIQRTAQLEAANRELEAFSYSVSHDLKAPLRAISGFSSMLIEDHYDKLDDEGKRLLNIIKDNIRKMGELIEDILSLSRIGRKKIDLLEIDMHKLARTIYDEIKATVPEREIQFEIKPLLPAYADEGLIHQVFFNLLFNAIKFTRLRENAVIEVGGYVEGQENVYYVRDNGVGFDMQYADKLFGAFQRLHSDKQFEGTGIGLTIVQRIINRHGGRVWAEGKVNEGAAFYFTLPKERICVLSTHK